MTEPILKPLVSEMTCHGEPVDYAMRIELIQPLPGKTVYVDFIAEDGFGVHHFGLLVEDFNARLGVTLELISHPNRRVKAEAIYPPESNSQL